MNSIREIQEKMKALSDLAATNRFALDDPKIPGLLRELEEAVEKMVALYKQP